MNIQSYIKYHLLETEYLEKEVHSFFHKNHHLTPEHFLAIIIWKSNRSKKYVIKGLKEMQEIGRTVKTITEEVYDAGENQNKDRQVEILTDIYGIGIPIASAILTILYPDRFTIYDIYLHEQLNGNEFKKYCNNAPFSKIIGTDKKDREKYFKFVDIVKEIAEKETGNDLRKCDRALWGKSWYNGLKQSVEKSGLVFRE